MMNGAHCSNYSNDQREKSDAGFLYVQNQHVEM